MISSVLRKTAQRSSALWTRSGQHGTQLIVVGVLAVAVAFAFACATVVICCSLKKYHFHTKGTSSTRPYSVVVLFVTFFFMPFYLAFVARSFAHYSETTTK